MDTFGWDQNDETIRKLLFGNDTENLLDHLNRLHCLIQNCVLNEDTLHLIDVNLLEEIKKFINRDNVSLHFGRSLRDMKCVIRDQAFRQHEIFITYTNPGKLRVSSNQLPYSNLQEREYSSLDDIISAFNKYINELAFYFQQLELIDEYCTVVEPARPSFKDDYRKILLDDRVWLHVEVTPEGLATNIQLVGQAEKWQNKLQEGLLSWDHDKNIVNNIMSVFSKNFQYIV
ncbi:hypothetical protein O3G_MSEX002169 [Manduca sexta]|uniref:FANCL UBC-like domain-containing protein n=1 Tax=Manduca sexta TaxID=7130 RepID=A0A922CDJ2_MANSE|nr:hypothetical protein O3G_MSEX002169 [Manduca sexta]